MVHEHATIVVHVPSSAVLVTFGRLVSRRFHDSALSAFHHPPHRVRLQVVDLRAEGGGEGENCQEGHGDQGGHVAKFCLAREPHLSLFQRLDYPACGKDVSVKYQVKHCCR
jgi:hypothetical protein